MKFNFHTVNLTIKKKFFSKKINYLFVGMLLLSTIGAFSGWLHQMEQQAHALAVQATSEQKADLVQKRMQQHLQNDITTTTVASYVGKDVAKYQTKLLKSANETVLYDEDLPYTGIVFVNTNVSLNQGEVTTKANAYDYVNLKYVHFDLATKDLTDVQYAPPPGLFTTNPTTWPSLNDSNNSLTTFFPTQTIRNAIKNTFGLDDTFSKEDWFNAFNKVGLTLDLSNDGLFSIAEIFNPNLRWGLGIYDLVATTNFTDLDFRIQYRGLSSLVVENNNLDYFPNPQFYNFPALKKISAKSNKIKAIGNFNTFSNSSPITEYQADLKNPTTFQAVDYYQYLSSLWANDSDVKDRLEVKGIKKWLTVTLPAINYTQNQATLKTGARTIVDYNSFLEAISGDPVFLNAENGEKWINQKVTTTTTSNNTTSNTTTNTVSNNNNLTPNVIGDITPFDPNGPETNNTGLIRYLNRVKNKGTNVAGVKIQITKDINEVDFSNNQIERMPLSRNMFTIMNFAGNKLKYLTPFALQPYPWAYNIAAAYKVPHDSYNFVVNPQNWNNLYKQSGGKPTNWNQTNSSDTVKNSSVGDVKKISPLISFYNNNLLDVWPQQGLDDSWYTWPRLTTKFVVGDANKPNSNVYGSPISPFNRQIGGNSEYYPYFHQVWFGPFNNANTGPVATLIGNWDPASGYTVLNDIDALSEPRNLEAVFFRQLVDNKVLISSQSYQKNLSFDASKNQSFVLPGFKTTSKRKVTIGGTNDKFNDQVLDKASDAYQSYNSHVPYILTRTWPQNMSNAFSLGRIDPKIAGNPQKIKVTLTDGTGNDITPNNFSDINWEELYANANDLTVNTSDPFASLMFKSTTGNYTPTITNTNGGDFLTKVLGQLPYYNDRGQTSWANATGNQALGLEKSLFEGKEFVQLNIEAPNLAFNFNYNITVLSNLNYSAIAKNPIDNDNQIEDIQASTFSKKNNFASEIQIVDLTTEQDTWLNASEYVKNYIIGGSDVIKIKNRDLVKGEITIEFNVVDATNSKIELPDITIKGFATQKVVLVKDQTTMVDDFNKKSNALTTFAPGTEVDAREWIKNHIGVKWIGLNRLNTSDTTSKFATGANLNDLQINGIYLLKELENPDQYMSGIVFDKNEGFLTFTIQINGTLANGDVSFVQSYEINSFARFSFSIDTTTASREKGALDFVEPTNLRQFVKLSKIHRVTGDDGNIVEEPIGTEVVWDASKNNEALIAENLIPAGTTLSITNITPNVAGGDVTFLVRLEETKDETLINIQQGTVAGLSTFSSSFDWKQNNNRFSGIAFIPYNNYATQLPSAFLEALKSSTDQNDFNNLMLPLIDVSKSAPMFDGSSHQVTGTQELQTSQLNLLQLGFGPSINFRSELVAQNVTTYDAARLIKIDNLYLKGGYKDGKFYAASEVDAPITALNSILVSFFVHTTEVKAINDTYNPQATTTTTPPASSNASSNKPVYDGETTIFANAFKEWSSLLPSEWFNRLAVLKNNKTQQTQVDYNKFDTVTGFLNHVLNTSTSNIYYGTRVDINDLNGVVIDDFKGTVNIKANTLLIYNEFKNPNAAITTETITPYNKEISFVLSNYFSNLSVTEVDDLPFATSDHVNTFFQDYNVALLQNQLQALMNKAQKLYDASNINSLTNSERNEAIDAIRILSSFFITPNYYNNPSSQKHFVTPFMDANASRDSVGKQTRFKDLTFHNVNYNAGAIDVTITVENYIKGYGFDNRFILGTKTQDYQITNLANQYLLPAWKNLEPVAFVVNSVNPNLKPIHNQVINGTIKLPEFVNIKAATYYEQLLTRKNARNLDYLVLEDNDPLFNLTMWNLVEASGLLVNDQSESVQAAFQQLIAALAKYHVSFNVKQSDVYFDATIGRIYINNPFLHFGTINDPTEVKEILKLLFNAGENKIASLDANNNWYSSSLSSVVLEGFQVEPLVIIPNDVSAKEFAFDLTEKQVRLSQILPSDLFSWLMQNYRNPTRLANFLNSFYTIKGTSFITHPIYLTFQPELMALLDQPNVSLAALSGFIRLNDGLGTFDLLNDAVAVVNGYLSPNAPRLTTPVPVKTFFATSQAQTTSQINLTQMNYVNTEVIVPTTDIQTNGAIASNFPSADLQSSITALEKDNFALAYNFLQLNEILSNNNQQQIVEIIKIEPNDVDASIVVHYVIHFGYEDGQNRTIQGQYTLTGFVSSTNQFLRIYLPIVSVVFSAFAFGLYLILNRVVSRNNSLPYTTVNRMRKIMKKNKKKVGV